MNLARQPHHLCLNAVIGAVRATRGRPGAGSVTMTMIPTARSCRSQCPIEHRRGGRVGGISLDEPCRYREDACSLESTILCCSSMPGDRRPRKARRQSVGRARCAREEASTCPRRSRAGCAGDIIEAFALLGVRDVLKGALQESCCPCGSPCLLYSFRTLIDISFRRYVMARDDICVR